MIEFDLQGHVLWANDNFLATTGYTLDEIQGQHHRMFCDATLAASDEYAAFWQRLRADRFESGEYKRVAKGGRAVWLRATYNPIFDMEGRPMKIVTFATDVTDMKPCSPRRRIRRSTVQRATASPSRFICFQTLSAP